ncbi:MAG: ATP-NAD kinase family protein [Eubacteriales bacterium]
MKKKLGLIVNPVAGMGGRVGLKGSDGEEIQKRARELGAHPESPRRAMDALERLATIKDDIEIITYPDEMGEKEARECGFEPVVIGSVEPGKTSAKDTIKAAREMAEQKVDLILFAGGDGTARNLYDALGDNGVPVIGIPAGVKIHSAVYATNSKNAGEVALMYLQEKIKKVQDSEVMDIDEDAFREGRVTAKLYGYLKVPHEERLVQHLKSGRTEGEVAALNSIADDITESMEDDVLYIIGPGTTTRAVMEKLGLKNTLLGVDVVLNKQLVASDVIESQLLDLIKGKKAKIVVTIIGGQGYIFGRGNQQLSPKVLRAIGKQNITVITPQNKLSAIGNNPLLIDTGDYEANSMLSGYYKVVTGYQRTVMRKAE